MIKISRPSDCCGCTACAAVCPANCIEMKADAEGFLAPAVNMEKCVCCGACERVCPMLHPPEVRMEPLAYAACNKIDTVRAHSSSGGVFSLLAGTILSAGGAICGAVYGDDFRVVGRKRVT